MQTHNRNNDIGIVLWHDHQGDQTDDPWINMNRGRVLRTVIVFSLSLSFVRIQFEKVACSQPASGRAVWHQPKLKNNRSKSFRTGLRPISEQWTTAAVFFLSRRERRRCTQSRNVYVYRSRPLLSCFPNIWHDTYLLFFPLIKTKEQKKLSSAFTYNYDDKEE